MAVKNGKIPPNISENDCIVVLPDDDYTVIVIKPNRKVKEELPRCKKVYKPDMMAERHNEIVAIAEFISPRSNSDSDTDTDTDGIFRKR